MKCGNPACSKMIPQPAPGDQWKCPFCGWLGHIHRPKEDSTEGRNHSLWLPDKEKALASQPPTVLLAMLVFGEARGAGAKVMQGVAKVAVNRAKFPHPVFGSLPFHGGTRPWTFEDNLRVVITKPRQFSSFNALDPNLPKLWEPLKHEKTAIWVACLATAQAAIEEREAPDKVTLNSDHYFDDSIEPPKWADPAKKTLKIGQMNFYRLYLPTLQLS